MTKPIAAHAGESSQPAFHGALTALALSMLLSSLGTSIANVSLPTLAEVFATNFQTVQWIVLGYLLTLTSLIVSAGRLGDLFGRRRVLLAGIVVFTTGSVLGGFAGTLGLLIVARAAQGVGAAAMMALTMAFVGETVPLEKTGRAMGLLGMTSAIGTALGPSLGGVLIAALGWRSIFLISAPLGALAFYLARHCLPPDRQKAKATAANFDWLGTFLLALSLAGYALAMTLGHGRFGAVNLALLVIAGLGTALFVLVESNVAVPLVRFAFLRDARLMAGLLMSGLVSTVMMTTLVVGPFYLSRGLGLDAAAVGLVLSSGPFVAALMGVPAGRLADRLGSGRVTHLGLIGLAIGSAILACWPAPGGVVAYVVPVVMMTVSYALFQTANNTSVMRDVSADRRGVVSGLLNLSRNLGLITGSSAMGAVFALASKTTDVARANPDAVTTGTRVTFAVAAGLIGVALVVARVVRPNLPLLSLQEKATA